MVKKYNKIITTIIKEKKSLTLFVVMSIDDLLESLTILIASKWINNKNSKDIFSYVLNLLKENLNDEELSKITRLSLYSEDEPSIQLFKKFETNDTIINQQINGFDIKRGDVIYSNF